MAARTDGHSVGGGNSGDTTSDVPYSDAVAAFSVCDVM